MKKATVYESASSLFFENSFVKIVINKHNGIVTSLYNKMNNEEAVGESDNPWFTYLYDANGNKSAPKEITTDGTSLFVTYENDIKATLDIEVKEYYFSVTLMTALPKTAYGIVVCNLTTSAEWELNNPDAFGLSAIPMTTTLDIPYRPGGENKTARAFTYAFLEGDIRGSKVGVAFSRMTEHRDHLKAITDDIDPKRGITSKHGGAYAYDNNDIYSDYVLLSSGLTPETADETIRLCQEYNVEQIDMHQGGGTFAQGDFDFWCARTPEEQENKTFIPASVFKQRVADKVKKAGIQLSLHTYSSLVPFWAEHTLTDPKWQKQLVTCPDVWTVAEDMSAEDTSIKTLEDASNIVIVPARAIPYNNIHTKCLLVDEEIILIQGGDKTGFPEAQRGMYGTKAAPHKKGTVIKQLYGWFGMFQPIPFSELFYEIARRTAKAYNDGGYDMIYLDGLESFAHEGLCDMRQKFYLFAEFVREVISCCNTPPMIEYSSFFPCLWAGRARGGAVDHARRSYKKHKLEHLTRSKQFLNCFYTATAGWFHYAPDMHEEFKDTAVRTLHRDDLDHMGSLCLAYNFGTVCQPFSIEAMSQPTRLSHNYKYYGVYSRLRKANYFAPEVKERLLDGNEHKVFKKADGSWAFKEMSYKKHKIYDLKEEAFSNGTLVNPYTTQTPFIRIEQRYSAGDDGVLLYEFDKTTPVKSYEGSHIIETINILGRKAFKLEVLGNNSDKDALLISITGPSHSEKGRMDYFVPLNFEGWKEIILAEANNDDFDGYEFEFDKNRDKSYRANADFSQINDIQLAVCGECDGVRIGCFKAYVPENATAKNPTITVGDTSITFDAELRSSDYIEYYPEFNKAYLNYYIKSNEIEELNLEDTAVSDEWNNVDRAHTKEINFSGALTVPSGSFNFSLKEESNSTVPVRAQVVFGFEGAIIENPESWTEPEIDIPANIEKVTEF